MEFHPPKFTDLLFSGVWFEWLVFVIGVGVSCIPLFRNVRGVVGQDQDKAPINIEGKWIIAGFAIIFLIGSAFIFVGKWNELQEDHSEAVYRKNADDNSKQQNASINQLRTEVKSYRKSDSTYRRKYDSARQVIGNFQKIEKGGRGIQNNAPNYGLQNLGDGNVYIGGDRTLTELGKQKILGDIAYLTNAYNVNCCYVGLVQNSNSPKIYYQIVELLESKGYILSQSPMVGRGKKMTNEIEYEWKEGVLYIFVGMF